MVLPVTSGSLLQCSFGMAPCPLNVLPILKPFMPTGVAGNILDFVPFLNISSFGMCVSLANPMVAAATAAAMGVLTPQPCLPALMSPWLITDFNTLFVAPALNESSKVMCAWGGVISVMAPMPVNVTI